MLSFEIGRNSKIERYIASIFLALLCNLLKFLSFDFTFSILDELSDKHNVHKIEHVMNDTFVMTSGLPDKTESHAADMATFVIELMSRITPFTYEGVQIFFKMGIHTGKKSNRIGLTYICLHQVKIHRIRTKMGFCFQVPVLLGWLEVKFLATASLENPSRWLTGCAAPVRVRIKTLLAPFTQGGEMLANVQKFEHINCCQLECSHSCASNTGADVGFWSGGQQSFDPKGGPEPKICSK